MKRRHDESEPPSELRAFDGIADGFTTPVAWNAAFERWLAARRRWAAEHGVSTDDMPWEVGDEPWDVSLI